MLGSIFLENLKFIQSFLKIKDHLTISFIQSKTIKNQILNYKQTQKDLVCANWKSSNLRVCDCCKNPFQDPYHKHVVTGNLKIIKNQILITFLSNLHKYMGPKNVNWSVFKTNLKESMDLTIFKCAKIFKTKIFLFSEWKAKVFSLF